MKKIVKAARTGELGINLIQRVVLNELGCMWYPTGGTEAGIDGTIELIVDGTDEATAQIISVQSKASSSFVGETPDRFEYLCKQRDLDYWLQGNTPVILVCSRPSTNEAYWVSIKDYFHDQHARATKKVVFNKHTDRFDKTARPALEKLAIPRDSGLYLGATPREEVIFSDLLPIRALPTRIYTARTSFLSRKEIFAKAGKKNSLSGSWTVHGKIVYSFEDLNSRAWKPYCEEGSIEDHPTSLLADTESAATRKIFVELLNFTLKDQLFALDLGYSSVGYFFQKPTPSLGQRTATYNSREKKATRVLFSAYQSKDGTTVSFYRHSGFKPQFYRFEGNWYLQIVPTYHFTTDGYQVSPLTGAALAGIKRLGCVHTMSLVSVKLFLPMELTEAQYERIKEALPVQRGNVSLSNLQVLNAVLYVAEQGCKWRGLPKRFGRWHTIYMRMSRWSKAGVLDRVFEKLQVEQIVRIKLEAVSLDSTSIKVHPDGTGALQKMDHRPSARAEADGTPRCIWLPRMLERP